MSTIINSRADLDAIAGTPRHAAFIAGLIGTLAHEPAADFIDAPAPAVADHERARWDGTEWIVEPVPEPPPPAPEPVPDQVSKIQLVRALRQAGIWETHVKPWIGTLSDAAQEDWALANYIPRSDPFVTDAQAALAWSDEQVDDLFRQAALL
jgi:hypothetical protein